MTNVTPCTRAVAIKKQSPGIPITQGRRHQSSLFRNLSRNCKGSNVKASPESIKPRRWRKTAKIRPPTWIPLSKRYPKFPMRNLRVVELSCYPSEPSLS